MADNNNLKENNNNLININGDETKDDYSFDDIAFSNKAKDKSLTELDMEKTIEEEISKGINDAEINNMFDILVK